MVSLESGTKILEENILTSFPAFIIKILRNEANVNKWSYKIMQKYFVRSKYKHLSKSQVAQTYAKSFVSVSVENFKEREWEREGRKNNICI